MYIGNEKQPRVLRILKPRFERRPRLLKTLGKVGTRMNTCILVLYTMCRFALRLGLRQIERTSKSVTRMHTVDLSNWRQMGYVGTLYIDLQQNLFCHQKGPWNTQTI